MSSLAFAAEREAVNVNSLDEVPDSAWFTNRYGPYARGPLEPLCSPSLLLHPEDSPDGAWIIDQGKMSGATPGFRVNIPGKGKYMFKADGTDQPELPTAASVVGAAIYHAAGFYTACEQIVYFRPSLLKLSPGLHYRHNRVEDAMDFDQKALDDVLKQCSRRGPLVRMHASAWIPGYTLGPFLYEGTRVDDPNDVIPHESRRDLRGARLIAAWIDHIDARDANSMDSWLADEGGNSDASPGHVVHYYLDTSDALGPQFASAGATPRLGYSYILSWGGMSMDFLSLGAITHPWDHPLGVHGYELFRSFDVATFVPDEWRMQYANPTFSNMTERDGAWMARILARFTPDKVRAIAAMAEFTDPKNTAHLAEVLEGRLLRILERYLTRLSPIGELRVDGKDHLCGVDSAASRGLREAGRFHYRVRWSHGGTLLTEMRGGGALCIRLPHIAGDGGPADDSEDRYVRLSIENGVAQAPLLAYLYDRGPARGYVLAGVERPVP